MGYRCGFVALIGRPNSGKSSLLNAVVGCQLSLVTPLAQTTNRVFRGIYTDHQMQLIFIDTPGVHQEGHLYNKAMSREAAAVLKPGESDLICYVIDTTRDYGPEEDTIALLVRQSSLPKLLVFNKEDVCPSPQSAVDAFLLRYPAFESTPRLVISALNPSAKEKFLRAVQPLLKEDHQLFPPEEITDAPLRFFATEYLRKHIIATTRQEVPHAACVEIESYRETDRKHYVSAVIHVETKGQRGIIIGEAGKRIEEIRKRAARDLEKLTGIPVSLSCHIKVSPRWRDNPAFLKRMGYRLSSSG